MGDRCYMEVWCRREDVRHFEFLGFVEQEEAPELRADAEPGPLKPLAYMVDEEADCAHDDGLPEGVPFVAVFGGGSNYGPGEIASDGVEAVEVARGFAGGYVTDYDGEGKPDPSDVEHVAEYLRLRRRVEADILGFNRREG